MVPGAAVNLAAGLWAVLALLLAAAVVVWVVRRRKGAPVCAEPDSLGSHPLQPPDGDGVARCACGLVVSIPAGATVRVGDLAVSVDPGTVGAPIAVGARTDTAEHTWPGGATAAVGSAGSVAAGDPCVWEAPTVERPLPHVVWPPRTD